MKKSIIFYSLAVISLLNSCIGAGIGDVSEDLGGGYRYLIEGSCSRIYSNFIFKDGIYPNVTNYAFNEKFIIVEQEPSFKEVLVFFENNLQSKYDLLLYMKDSIKMDKNVKAFMRSKIWTDSILHKEISMEVLPENNLRSSKKFTEITKKIISEDSVFKDMFSRKINYYIIDKERQEVFGPYSKKNI